jgi:alpha,alpha-trehalase
MSVDCSQAYRPISDYALIGDCHGAALVASDGTIDWCSLERFDADPALFRILDAGSGGYLSVAPTGTHAATRAYVTDTNLLQTTLDTQHGSVVLTDFMPVGRRPGSATHDYVDLVAPGCLVRIVEVTRGSVELAVQYRARARCWPRWPTSWPGTGMNRRKGCGRCAARCCTMSTARS